MRVLQLNIWARSGPYRDREPRLRQLFAEAAPDLVAMQEVDLSAGGGNQAAELLDGLGYEIVHEPQGANRNEPGVAVASRLPVCLVITSCRVVGTFAEGAAPSDHYGVLAEIELDGDRVGRGRGLDAWDETAAELWPS